MIDLILGLIGAFVGVVTAIGGALYGTVTALGGVFLGLAMPFAPLLVVAGLLVFLVAGQKYANQAPPSPRQR